MKSFVYLSVFAVLFFTLSLSSIQDVHAQNIDLDGDLACGDIGGWYNQQQRHH
jgi:hypothetical protein